MRAGRSAALAVAVSVAATATGCGLGPGQSSPGEATLTVTRDYGSKVLLEASEEDPPESETVIRFLDRETEVTTRYGGGFVHSIDGLAGTVSDGRASDWFFFVNGIESPRGAADVQLRGGDRVWWDYRDWTAAMRAPAVVGSWPEPFAQVSAGTDRLPVRVECLGLRSPCSEAAGRLAEQGVDVAVEGAREAARETDPALRLLVGPWAAVRRDPAAAMLEDGPGTSGVFARFARAGDGWRLTALDQRAQPVDSFTAGAGLVAGLRKGDDPPTWVVTGTDRSGVPKAVALLARNALEHRYAVLAIGAREISLPQEAPR